MITQRLWALAPTDTPCRGDVDSMAKLRRYVEEKISTIFDVISTYFFDVISMGEKWTSFRRTFSMSEKSMLFRRTFFDIISMSQKSMLFRCTFFDLISMNKKLDIVSTYFFKQFRWKTDANSRC